MTAKEKILSLTAAANTATGKADADLTAAMASLIDGYGQSGIEKVEWHQCPEAVRNYLDNVSYDPADYTVSYIADYAPATAVTGNMKPIGKTVDGVTYYNEVPELETPFSSANVAGTVKPLDRLRWLNTPSAPNVRDLGGWNCDGGTIKYGMLVRGGQPDWKHTPSLDRDVLVNQCGIRAELNLLGRDPDYHIDTKSPLGDDILFKDFDQYIWYTLSHKDTWKGILRYVFENVTHKRPVFFHCGAGKDRTGTVAIMLEALLGMSQIDIDKDYELTSFAYGNTSTPRTFSDYKNYIAAIWNYPLEGGLTDTFRNHAISFVLSLGFTAEEINAYRSAMIDGIPESITPDIGTQSVTNNLTNVDSSNADTTVARYQPYTANLKVPNGYIIQSVKITMGGTDITGSVFHGTRANRYFAIAKSLSNCTLDSRKAVIAGQDYVASLVADFGYTFDGGTVMITMGGNDMSSYYSDGKIAIPNVTGDIEITAIAVASAPSYTNLATSFETGRLNSSGNVDSGTPAATTCTDYIAISTDDTVRIKGFGDLKKYNTSIYTASKAIASSKTLNTQTVYGIYAYDESTGVVTFTITKSGINGYYMRFSGILAGTTEDVIITRNEEI